jgi:hypothetical protein
MDPGVFHIGPFFEELLVAEGLMTRCQLILPLPVSRESVLHAIDN